jgi:Concanavalin A-like lectin/glucanases superfamily/IPT/TIG domain
VATTLVGSPVTDSGVKTLTMSPAAVGNGIVLYVKIPDNVHVVTQVVDTKGANWQRVADPVVDTYSTPHTHEMWLGTVTATGSTIITVTNSGGTVMDLCGQEGSSGLGASTTWSRDGTQQGFRNNATSTTVTYPTLTPAASAWACYHGRCPNGSSYSGTTAGYVSTTDANGNQFINNPVVSAGTSPTSTSSVSTPSFCIGVLIAAVASAPAPTVTGVSPASGTTSGTTSVTITGTNLTGATAVKFGATNATSFVVTGSTQITAVAPAHAAGTVDITIVTPGGTSATGAADQYTFAVVATTPFPTLILEWSPTTSPAATPVWVDITSRLRRFSINRGRRNWLSTTAPGTATFDLDNTDLAGTSTAGPFTPFNSSSANYPNVIPGKRVQLRATFGGITYARFVGFTTGYPTTWNNTDSQVTMSCVDGLALLALATLNGVYAQTVLADNPTSFYRFLESAGPTAADSSANGNTATYSAVGITWGQTDPITDGTNHAVLFDGQHGYVTTPTFPALSNNWSIEGWFMVPPGATQTQYALSSDRTLFPSWNLTWGIGGTPGGTIAFTVNYIDGTFYQVVSGLTTYNDSAWHHVVVTWSAANVVRLYVDGAQVATSSSAATTFPARPFTIGPVDDGALLLSAAEVAIYYDTTLSAAQVAAHYAARTSWLGDRSDARIGRILDAVSWLITDRNIQAGSSILAAADDYAGKSPATAINEVATTDNGLVFIDQGGRLTFLGRTTLQLAPYNVSQGTFGDNVAEIAYPMGDGKITADDQDLWTRIAVQKKGGALFTATASQAAIAKFYTVRQPGTINTLTTSDFEAIQLANWLLAQSSTPAPRIDTLNMLGNAGNLASLMARELGDFITYRGRPAGVGTVSQAARILGMRESADLKERIYKFSWLLFAKESQTMIWDDATFGKWDTYVWGI